MEVNYSDVIEHHIPTSLSQDAFIANAFAIRY